MDRKRFSIFNIFNWNFFYQHSALKGWFVTHAKCSYAEYRYAECDVTYLQILDQIGNIWKVQTVQLSLLLHQRWRKKYSIDTRIQRYETFYNRKL